MAPSPDARCRHARFDVVVFAAFDPEIAALRTALGGALEGRVGSVRVAARTVGVGLPAAAAGAAACLAEVAARAAVLVGTCGAYPGSGLALGEVVVARRVLLGDASVSRGLAEYPAPMAVATGADETLAARLAETTGAPLVDVATTLAITVDDAAASDLARSTGARVEHLEALGVAAACAARGVAFGAVLAVANAVGARGRAEWRSHHREAEDAAARAALRGLAAMSRDDQLAPPLRVRPYRTPRGTR